MKKYYDLIKEGEDAYARGDVVEAIQFYERACHKKRIVDIYLRLGFLYKESHEHLRAALVFQNIRNYLKIPDAYFGIGQYYQIIGENERALSYYIKVVNVFPGYAEGQFAYANLLDKKSKQLADKNNNLTVEIIKAYRAAIRNNPNHPLAPLQLGLFFLRIGKTKYSKECLLDAYKRKVPVKHLCFYLADFYEKTADYDQAINFYLQEINCQEPLIKAYHQLGLLYKKYHGDYQLARQYFLLALEKDENYYQVWYDLMVLYCLLEDYDNASKCYDYLWLKNNELLDNIEYDKELQGFLVSDYYKSK